MTRTVSRINTTTQLVAAAALATTVGLVSPAKANPDADYNLRSRLLAQNSGWQHPSQAPQNARYSWMKQRETRCQVAATEVYPGSSGPCYVWRDPVGNLRVITINGPGKTEFLHQNNANNSTSYCSQSPSGQL